MEPLNEQLVERIDRYIEELFTPPDDALAANLRDAAAAGMPSIAVSPNQGKLLYLLTKLAGAKKVLEIGTLGGYSTTWLARALPPDGRVITLEMDPKHAEIAQRNIARAGVGEQVEIIVGMAHETLRRLIRVGAGPFDVIFIDADKTSYPEYLELSLELARPGTLLLADNVIRNGNVIDADPADAFDRGAKLYNEAAARHPRLETIVLPIVRQRVDGMAISIVTSVR